MIYMKDRRGRLTYANAAALRLMGLSSTEIGTVDSTLFSDTAEYDGESGLLEMQQYRPAAPPVSCRRPVPQSRA